MKIKLTDLNPRWTGLSVSGHELVDGITFDCPHCRNQRLGVKFTPPLDKNNWKQRSIEYPIYQLMWQRVGDTFETITLSPSVNANSRIDFQNHWHGFIENGFVS